MFRKCFDIVALVIVLLIAVDRYYPAAMSMLGFGADKSTSAPSSECR